MIILASNSEQRKNILKKYLNFKIIPSNIEENNEYFKNPEQLVMGLSLEKGMDIAQKNENDIIISADTVVYMDGNIYGKPKDREDAKKMLINLSSKIHEVYTGYSLINLQNKIKYVDYEVSYVHFKNLSDDEIERYLDTNEYENKAGAYGIQGYGNLLIKKIDGDYFNIVGLPISKIYDDLKKLFNVFLMGENYDKE